MMEASPSKLLHENLANEETQRARLDALHGKRVLWITAPVIPGMSENLKKLARFPKSHGVHIIGVFQSDQDKLYQVMLKDGLFAKAIFANLSDQRGACGHIVEAVRSAGLEVDGVFSPYENAMPLVGAVAEALGLPGNPSKSYSIARSKNMTRVATQDAGLATPRSGVAKSKEELFEVLDKVGYPCILKTSSGAGSCGVFRANDQDEAVVAFDKIVADLAENGVLSYNPGCEECTVLIEQLLVGDEFDVDMLLWDGQSVYHQVVDNWPCLAPFYLETGSLMPGKFSKAQQQEIADYALACVQALGFKCGAFHVEVMLTKEDGPVLIEVNARQGGGSNQVFNLEMTGVDIFANFFMALIGIPINPPRKEITFAMGDFSVTAPRTGILVDDDFMEPVRKHPNVFSHNILAKVGEKVTGLDTFPQWIGEFTVKGDSPEHCEEIIQTLAREIDNKINIIPENNKQYQHEHQLPQEESILKF